MPRYYSSFSELPLSGWKARQARSAAQRFAREAIANDPAELARAASHRRLRDEVRLLAVVTDAEEHVAKLKARLAAAYALAERMADAAYRTGEVRAEASKVRASIEFLPGLIARAEDAHAAALAALDAHRRAMADAAEAERVAAAEPILMASETISEPPPLALISLSDASTEGPRGRGRPRKVHP